MLDGLFLFFIALAAVYLLVAPRKEFPLVVILHTVVQYALTMLAWQGALPPPIAVLTMGCMWSAALVMIWVRTWAYSPRLQYANYLARVMQWAVLGVAVLDVFGHNSSAEMLVGNALLMDESTLTMVLREANRFIGNLLVFMSFLQIILHWGQHWTVKKSLLDLFPVVGYFMLMLVLRLLPTGAPLIIN